MTTTSQDEIVPLPGTSLDFKIGSKAILFLEALKQKKISELVGADCFRFLILKTNLAKPELEHLYTNRTLKVHLATEGSIFLFKSNIVEITTSPAQYFFVEWPYSVQKKNLRKAKRYTCAISCLIQDDNVKHAGVIQDINRLGCCIQLQIKLADPIRRVEEGKTVTLFIQSEYGEIEKQFRICNKKEKKGIMTLGGTFMEPLENILSLVTSSLAEAAAEEIEIEQ